MQIRSIVTQVTQTHREAGAAVDPPTVIAVAALVCWPAAESSGIRWAKSAAAFSNDSSMKL